MHEVVASMVVGFGGLWILWSAGREPIVRFVEVEVEFVKVGDQS